MKIALLTWFHYRNYGTALQVYALSSVLTEMGHEVDVINYIPGPFKPRTLQNMSVRAVSKKVMSKLGRPQYGAAWYKQYESPERGALFSSFISEKLSFTAECRTLSDLCELNGKYDAFVCGSDQIWSPNNFDPRYFLDFVASPDKMIAYAPSIGLECAEDPYVAEQMSELIGRFKHLSVREKQGADLIKTLTGLDAEVVCDPTVLLGSDGWEKLCEGAERHSDDPYMLVYMLGNNSAHWSKVYADAAEKGLSVKVIPVHEVDTARKGCMSDAVGPKEFLRLIKNADAVYTDSFHGMVMSLLLSRPFVPFERFSPADPICQNSRVYNFLSVAGRSDCLVSYDGECVSPSPAALGNAADAVCRYRESSREYLERALKAVSEKRDLGKRRVLYSCPLCCGCGACENVCPVGAVTLKMNESGFIRACVDEEKCVGCGKCESVCPMLGEDAGKTVEDTPLYSFKNNDPDVLWNSSSGGFAYTLSRLLIEAGYSVAGCIFDEKDQRARHVLVNSIDGLSQLQGSKYMQSEFSTVLSEIKECKTPVAIFGTPCQISAARKLLSGRDDVVYIDLICHGVPTYNLYRKYKRTLSRRYGFRENGIVTKFRYKDKGWRVIRLHSADSQSSVCFDQREDMFYRAFETGDCYSPACYECRWRDRSEADIRIGDYWGTRFENDSTGVNMVSVFTESGEKLMNMLAREKGCSVDLQSAGDYMTFQQILNRPQPLFYKEYLRRLADGKEDLEVILRRYCAPFEGYEADRRKRYKRYVLTAIDENLHCRRRNRKK